MNPIELKNVDVLIEQQKILNNINFTVKRGEMIGLIGPNGSGKSTLLRAITTLLPISKGTILLEGKNESSYNQKERAKLMSYVPQETLLTFDFKARDVVAMGRHVYGSVFKSESKEDIEAIDWAMQVTKTAPLADQSILSLSGGQRQLVMIAKALAQDTPLILLDEPISALDVYYQLHILELLKKLCEQGRTMIVVLHDLNLAARFCQHLILLNEGEIQTCGTPESVLTTDRLADIYHIQANIKRDAAVDAITITPFL